MYRVAMNRLLTYMYVRVVLIKFDKYSLKGKMLDENY